MTYRGWTIKQWAQARNWFGKTPYVDATAVRHHWFKTRSYAPGESPVHGDYYTNSDMNWASDIMTKAERQLCRL